MIGYDKVEFIKSISKICLDSWKTSSFSVMQLKCFDSMLHWIVMKVITANQTKIFAVGGSENSSLSNGVVAGVCVIAGTCKYLFLFY